MIRFVILSVCVLQKSVDQEPTATMLQLDAVRGNVNTVANDNIRTSYQVCQAPV